MLIVLFGIIFIMQRLGQKSEKDRKKWLEEKAAEGQNKPDSKAELDAPRFKLATGVVIPALLGIVMLVFAMKVAAHR